MKKFMRILSPIQLAIVGILDIAVIGYTIFAIKKLIQNPRSTVIFFAACVVVALIVAVLVTKEVVSHGVIFHDDEMEFTGLDSDNIFAYENIVKVETQKDDKPSFVKNYIDRQSKIILTLKDDKVVTIDIGITTKGTLKKISDEICSHIGTQPVEINETAVDTQIETSDIDIEE
ncbi:MAG: hypothetical protein J1E36_01250 [Eubacterium sp.]|nr:hypothetical protein [Eubacterium sp.]